MNPFVAASSLFLSTVAFAGPAPLAAIGHFKWVPNSDSVAFYRRHHAPVPTGQIVLTQGGIFRYSMSDETRTETTLGTFTVDADRIFFRIENGLGAGLPLRMKLDGVGLSAVGTSFVREKLALEQPVRLSVPPSPALHTEIEGVWTLRSSGLEDAATRFIFSGFGTFRYGGIGSSSAGLYRVTDDGIELEYTEVDSEPLDARSHFHKTLPFCDGRIAFQVDTYRYERSSR